MFKKSIALGVAVLLSATALVGCGSGSSNDGTPAEKGGDANGKKAATKVAMVTDVGGVNDQSFNQSAWEGLQEVKKDFGFDVNHRESNQEADYGPNIDAMVDAGNDLVFGIGFKMGTGIEDAAANYPDQKFAIIDFAYEKTPDNVIGILFKDQESSYLVGLIAGKMTETNKVGFIGGIESEVISRFHYGFMAGVKDANPNAEILVQYANAFDKPAEGKAIANQMYQQGADIIFHASGDTGTGLIEAAKEQNKWAIGVDRDQNYLAPDNVLTSSVKGVDVAVYDICKDLYEGDFKGGKTVVYGLSEGGVDIAPTSNKHVPADILEFVEEQKQKIIKGEIEVPGTEEEYKAKY